MEKPKFKVGETVSMCNTDEYSVETFTGKIKEGETFTGKIKEIEENNGEYTYHFEEAHNCAWSEKYITKIEELPLATQIINLLEEGNKVVVKTGHSLYSCIYPCKYEDLDYKMTSCYTLDATQAKNFDRFFGMDKDDIKDECEYKHFTKIVEYEPYEKEVKPIPVEEMFYDGFNTAYEWTKENINKYINNTIRYNVLNNSSNEQKGETAKEVYKTIKKYGNMPERDKPMSLVGKLKQIAKSKEQKRVDKYLMMGENGFNTDGVNIILSTLMEDKEFAKKIDEKLAKIEKVEEKKK